MADPREEVEAVTEAILACNAKPGPKLTHFMARTRARVAIAALDAARSTQPEKTSAPDTGHAEGRRAADDPTDDAEDTGGGQGRDSATVTEAVIAEMRDPQLHDVLDSAAAFLYRRGVGEGSAGVDAARRLLRQAADRLERCPLYPAEEPRG